MSDQSIPRKISPSKLNLFSTISSKDATTKKSPSQGSSHSPDLKQVDKWAAAINSLDTSRLVKLMIDEVSKIPFKKKRDLGAVGDHDVVQKILGQMNDLLSHNFLHIDFKSASRDVASSDWSKVTSCRRSDSVNHLVLHQQHHLLQQIQGNVRAPTPTRSRSPIQGHATTLSTQVTNGEYSEIIVAKPVSKEDFERQLFVNEITKEFFKIHCPAIRFISKSDDEFKVLEEAVHKLFTPFHEELYTNGGQGSPKALFESHAIMLMELVKGKPLCHRTEGQRVLKDEDFRAVGRLFLLDLLIRNTDRLPCRKAIPRPGSITISDHGNAGNLMFGDTPGSLWAIDPEMQTNIDITRESDYMKSLESILLEIINDEISMTRYKSLDLLYFNSIPGLAGILETSLEEFTPWAGGSVLQQEAIASILSLIRIRAKAEDGAIITRANGISPPENNSEREWREWIRIATPRAVIDVLKFIEVYTGYKCPPTAAASFEQGFLEALAGAIDFQKEIKSPFGSMAIKRQSLFRILLESSQIDVGFIRRMIDGLSKICPTLPYPSPTATCDDPISGYRLARGHVHQSNKRLMSIVDKVTTPKTSGSLKEFTAATAAYLSKLTDNDSPELPSPYDRDSRSNSGSGSGKTSSSTEGVFRSPG